METRAILIASKITGHQDKPFAENFTSKNHTANIICGMHCTSKNPFFFKEVGQIIRQIKKSQDLRQKYLGNIPPQPHMVAIHERQAQRKLQKERDQLEQAHRELDERERQEEEQNFINYEHNMVAESAEPVEDEADLNEDTRKVEEARHTAFEVLRSSSHTRPDKEAVLNKEAIAIVDSRYDAEQEKISEQNHRKQNDQILGWIFQEMKSEKEVEPQPDKISKKKRKPEPVKPLNVLVQDLIEAKSNLTKYGKTAHDNWRHMAQKCAFLVQEIAQRIRHSTWMNKQLVYMKNSLESTLNSKSKPKTAKRPKKSESANVSKSSQLQKPVELHALTNEQECEIDAYLDHLFQRKAGSKWVPNDEKYHLGL